MRDGILTSLGILSSFTYANGSVVNKVIGDTSFSKNEEEIGWLKR